MKLFLSSYKIGHHSERLLELAGENKQVAVIVNAHDHKKPSERAIKVQGELDDLRSIGLEPFEYDLRVFFKKRLDTEKLEKCGLVWVRGGNVFVLRLAMKLSGFDEYMLYAIENDRFVYGGYSAAGCVLSPDLKYYDIVDNPFETQKAYQMKAEYSGIGVLDYYFQPHYKSDHPESMDIDKEISRIKKAGKKYKTLRDGEVLIIENDYEEIIS